MYENTHLELLPAREMMKKLGMKSAAVVAVDSGFSRNGEVIFSFFATDAHRPTQTRADGASMKPIS